MLHAYAYASACMLTPSTICKYLWCTAPRLDTKMSTDPACCACTQSVKAMVLSDGLCRGRKCLLQECMASSDGTYFTVRVYECYH
jgi:hypothetical protein